MLSEFFLDVLVYFFGGHRLEVSPSEADQAKRFRKCVKLQPVRSDVDLARSSLQVPVDDSFSAIHVNPF